MMGWSIPSLSATGNCLKSFAVNTLIHFVSLNSVFRSHGADRSFSLRCWLTCCIINYVCLEMEVTASTSRHFNWDRFSPVCSVSLHPHSSLFSSFGFWASSAVSVQFPLCFVITSYVFVLWFVPTGVDFNVLNSKFSFDLLPGKRAARRNISQPKVCMFHPAGNCSSRGGGRVGWGNYQRGFNKRKLCFLIFFNS